MDRLAHLLLATALCAVCLLVATVFWSEQFAISSRLMYSSGSDRRTEAADLLHSAPTNRAAVAHVQNTAVADLLLYRHDAITKEAVRVAHSSGELLKLVRKVSGGTKSLPHSFPNLDFSGYSFSSFNGTQLPTTDTVRDLLVRRRNSTHPVTNVVNFFAFSFGAGGYSLKFPGYLSFLGALWLSGADFVVVWCNRRPVGHFWNLFLRNVTQSGVEDRVLFASRKVPDTALGVRLGNIHHKIDVMKLETSILLGGVFLDNDSLTLRSLQNLRRNTCVIGRESPTGLSIGAFMSAPSSAFIILWYLQYQGYYPGQWSTMSVAFPNILWHRYPKLCRVEDDTMTRPNWFANEAKMLFANSSQLSTRWKWHNNYMVHIWRSTMPGSQQDEKSINTADSMYGEVARYVLYGSEKLRS